MRESFRVRNTTLRDIAIGDLPASPVISARTSSDLALYHSIEEIKNSSDLATLLATGWLVLSKSSSRTTKSLDTVEIDELEASGNVLLAAISSVSEALAALEFIDLPDVPNDYRGDANKALVVRPDELGVTFSNITTGAPAGLDDIPDVTITYVQPNDVLTYDEDTGQWINRPTFRRSTFTITSDYNAIDDDNFIFCDAISGAITITLPPPTDGQVFHIKKIDSSGYSVIIEPDGAETIDGDTSLHITEPYSAVQIVSDGSNWFIF